MRGNDTALKFDTKRLQLFGRVLHDIPIAIATHYYADLDHRGYPQGKTRDFTEEHTTFDSNLDQRRQR